MYTTLYSSLLVSLACVSAQAQTFQGIGIPSGGTQSFAVAISTDGTTVVGNNQAVPNERRAWKWRASTGQVVLPTIPGYTFAESAVGVSSDGSVVLGSIGEGNLPSQIVTALWRENQSTTVIPDLYQPLGISGDGSTVVGKVDGSPNNNAARRWTQATETQPLGELAPGPYNVGWTSVAYATNFDGSIVVGSAYVQYQSNPPRASGTPMIWTPSGGARVLLNNGSLVLGAGITDMTPDGSVFVGTALINGVDQLFRYTDAGGYQFISSNGNTISFPTRTSDDGNTIISRLTYWTPQTGAISLQQALTLSGCDFTGWTIQEVIDISGDGRTLVGNGLNPQGVQEAWIATIPTPGVMLPLVMVGLFAGRRRR